MKRQGREVSSRPIGRAGAGSSAGAGAGAGGNVPGENLAISAAEIGIETGTIIVLVVGDGAT